MSQAVVLADAGDQVAEYFDGFRLRLPSGIVLGSKDTLGVEWRLEDVSGWDNTASTTAITQRAYANGGWANRAFLAPRYITATGKIWVPGQNRPLLRDAVDRLITSVPLNEFEPLTLQQDGQDRFVYARGDQEQLTQYLQADLASFSLQFVAPDPRKLTAGFPIVESTGLAASDGGLTVPFTVPFSIDATVTSGVIYITNQGNTVAPAVLKINGPVREPTVRHAESGREIAFDVTLGQYEWLEVDLDTRSVILNGQVSRRGSMRGTWFDISPGLNTLSFASLTYSPDALLTVTTRNAWK